MDIALSRKYRELQERFLQHQIVAVAFSGGVDSSFLLYAACVALGPSSVHAFHAQSDLLPPQEAEQVEKAIRERGCFFHPIEIKPFGWPEFVVNGADRCYHCKKKIYQTFLADPIFSKSAVLFDGTNHDDLGRDRPGLRAVSELNVQTPLADVGFTKKEIRALSREFFLSTWCVYASSCFSTRIESGEAITKEKILLVSQCEALLREKGFMGVRVRLSGETATIVVLQQDLPLIKNNDVLSNIKASFLFLGLHKVLIDRQGRSDWLE